MIGYVPAADLSAPSSPDVTAAWPVMPVATPVFDSAEQQFLRIEHDADV